jgi:hypothetical protein
MIPFGKNGQKYGEKSCSKDCLTEKCRDILDGRSKSHGGRKQSLSRARAKPDASTTDNNSA